MNPVDTSTDRVQTIDKIYFQFSCGELDTLKCQWRVEAMKLPSGKTQNYRVALHIYLIQS